MKQICCIDLETSGLDPIRDHILQWAMVKFNPETFEIIDEWMSYINPEEPYEISPGAAEVNGLTKEFLRVNGKPLKDLAKEILKFIGDCDYLTYNGNNFDVKFCYNELQSIGFEFPVSGRKFYDSCLIERKLHSCHLVDVFTRYTGQSMEEAGLKAHDAFSDVKATIKVFENQAKLNRLDEMSDWQENNLLGIDGSIRNTAKNGLNIVFNNGKYKDRDIYNVMNEDPDYIRWWSQKIASKESLNVARAYCAARLKASNV